MRTIRAGHTIRSTSFVQEIFYTVSKTLNRADPMPTSRASYSLRNNSRIPTSMMFVEVMLADPVGHLDMLT